MKHLSQQMISLELRKSHIQRAKRSLQEVLRRPGLTAREREEVKKSLFQLGKPKKYGNQAPQPGAIDPGPMPVRETEIDLGALTFENLSSKSHSQLYQYAKQKGISVNSSDTKALIVKAILATSQGEKP